MQTSSKKPLHHPSLRYGRSPSPTKLGRYKKISYLLYLPSLSWEGDRERSEGVEGNLTFRPLMTYHFHFASARKAAKGATIVIGE